jgi:hypothetical protein
MPTRSELVLLGAGVVLAAGVLLMAWPRTASVTPPPDADVLVPPPSLIHEGLSKLELGMPRDVVTRLLGGPANSAALPEWKKDDDPHAEFWSEADVWQDGDLYVDVTFDEDGRLSGEACRRHQRRDDPRGGIRLR